MLSDVEEEDEDDMPDLEGEEEEEGEKENEDNCNDGGTPGPKAKRKRNWAHGNSSAIKEPNEKKIKADKSDEQGAAALFTHFVFLNYVFKAGVCVAMCPTVWFLPPSEEVLGHEDAEASLLDHPADSES